MHFDTKIAIVVRDDLAAWQKLNVTAFLTTGVTGQVPDLLGEVYEDAAGNSYNRLCIQAIIVLTTDAAGMRKIYERAMGRGVKLSLYIEEMFETGHDEAKRATVKARRPEEMSIVGLALREERRIVDKITKGARMYG